MNEQDRNAMALAIEEDPIHAYAKEFGSNKAEILRSVPEHLRGGLVRYILLGIRPGDFLQAVLENNLMESFGRADDISRAGLFHICLFLHNAAPIGCYRSKHHFDNWVKTGGIYSYDIDNLDEISGGEGIQ